MRRSSRRPSTRSPTCAPPSRGVRLAIACRTSSHAEWLVVYGSLMRDLPTANGELETDLLDRLGVGARPATRRALPRRRSALRSRSLSGASAVAARAGSVCGELHAILDPDVLAVLDAFEGYDPRIAAGSDYLRERVELLEPRGRARLDLRLQPRARPESSDRERRLARPSGEARATARTIPRTSVGRNTGP